MDYQYITNKSGIPVSVVVPIAEWQQIQKKLRRLSDQRVVSTQRNGIGGVLKKYENVKPFREIDEPVEWQKVVRDEW